MGSLRSANLWAVIRSMCMLAVAGSLVTGCAAAEPPGGVTFIGQANNSNDDGGGGTTAQNLAPVPGNPNHTSGNPFAGTVMYINPDYVAEVQSSVAMFGVGSSDANLAAKAKSFPTAVWLDHLGALAGGAQNGNRMSLHAHLEAAADQSIRSGQQVNILFVLFDLPDRLCGPNLNGEFTGAAGLADYKSKFIDGIYSALTASSRYQNLHVTFIVEPQSLAQIVNNANDAACNAVAQSGEYTNGISYAAQRLGSLPNVYLYLDLVYAGWFGWPGNANAAAKVYAPLINSNAGLFRGFAINIGNYVPVSEPFLDPNTAKDMAFYGGNPSIDNASYVRTLAKAFSDVGIGNMAFIIDTSRSGWPTVNDGKPIDRRHVRTNYCNVGGAGIGARPQSNPTLPGNLDVDAFVFVKAPGESDGASTNGSCDPSEVNSDSLANAPKQNTWFHDGFMEMMRLATPGL